MLPADSSSDNRKHISPREVSTSPSSLHVNRRAERPVESSLADDHDGFSNSAFSGVSFETYVADAAPQPTRQVKRKSVPRDPPFSLTSEDPGRSTRRKRSRRPRSATMRRSSVGSGSSSSSRRVVRSSPVTTSSSAPRVASSPQRSFSQTQPRRQHRRQGRVRRPLYIGIFSSTASSRNRNRARVEQSRQLSAPFPRPAHVTYTRPSSTTPLPPPRRRRRSRSRRRRRARSVGSSHSRPTPLRVPLPDRLAADELEDEFTFDGPTLPESDNAEDLIDEEEPVSIPSSPPSRRSTSVISPTRAARPLPSLRNHPLLDSLGQFEECLIRCLLVHIPKKTDNDETYSHSPRRRRKRTSRSSSSSSPPFLSDTTLTPSQALWLATTSYSIFCTLETVLRGFFESFIPQLKELCPRGVSDPSFQAFVTLALKLNRSRIVEIVLSKILEENSPLLSDEILQSLLLDAVVDLGSLLHVLPITANPSVEQATEYRFEIGFRHDDCDSWVGKMLRGSEHQVAKIISMREGQSVVEVDEDDYYQIRFILCPALVVRTTVRGEGRECILVKKSSVIASVWEEEEEEEEAIECAKQVYEGLLDYRWSDEVIGSSKAESLSRREVELDAMEKKVKQGLDGLQKQVEERINLLEKKELELNQREELLQRREFEFDGLQERVEALRQAESLVRMQSAKMSIRMKSIRLKEAQLEQQLAELK